MCHGIYFLDGIEVATFVAFRAVDGSGYWVTEDLRFLPDLVCMGEAGSVSRGSCGLLVR